LEKKDNGRAGGREREHWFFEIERERSELE